MFMYLTSFTIKPGVLLFLAYDYGVKVINFAVHYRI